MNVPTVKTICYFHLFKYNFCFLKGNKIAYFLGLQYVLFLLLVYYSNSPIKNLQNVTLKSPISDNEIGVLTQIIDFLSMGYFFSYIIPFTLIWLLYQKRLNNLSQILFQNGNYFIFSEILFILAFYIILVIPCILIVLHKVSNLPFNIDKLLIIKLYISSFFCNFLYLVIIILLSFLIKNKVILLIVHFINLPLISFDEARFWIPINWSFSIFRYFEPTYREMVFFVDFPPDQILKYFVFVYLMIIFILFKLILNVQTKKY